MAAPSPAPARAPKPVLSKADRRAQQEAQRAAKGQKPSGGSSKPAASPAPVTAAASRPTGGSAASGSTSRPSAQPVTASASASGAGANAAASTSQAAVPTDIFRRFFHHLDAGEGGRTGKQRQDAIHPAVARLALLYAEYRIVGANARCIALVETFKEVRCRAMLPCPRGPTLADTPAHRSSARTRSPAATRSRVICRRTSARRSPTSSRRGRRWRSAWATQSAT